MTEAGIEPGLSDVKLSNSKTYTMPESQILFLVVLFCLCGIPLIVL